MEDVLPVELDPVPTLDSRAFTLSPREAESFREVLRQQYLGDQELLRDCVAGREDPEIRLQVYDRICLTRRLAEQVGVTVVERRREPAKQDGYLRLPISVLVCAAGIGLCTAAVYTAYRVGLGALPVLYIPVTAHATLRYGRRAGTLAILGSVLAYSVLDPDSPYHLARGLVTLTALLFAIWIIRKDLF